MTFSVFSIVFHWCVWLSPCQHHTVLITVVCIALNFLSLLHFFFPEFILTYLNFFIVCQKLFYFFSVLDLKIHKFKNSFANKWLDYFLILPLLDLYILIRMSKERLLLHWFLLRKNTGIALSHQYRSWVFHSEVQSHGVNLWVCLQASPGDAPAFPGEA